MRSLNHCCRGESLNIKYSECCLHYCLSYLVCESHLCSSILYCFLWPVRLTHMFPHYLINATTFGKKTLLNIKHVFWISLQILSERFLILNRIQREIIIHFLTYSCKVPVILVRVHRIPNFLNWISKNTQMSNFNENPSSGSWVVPCGRTDMPKLIVTFRHFSNTPKR